MKIGTIAIVAAAATISLLVSASSVHGGFLLTDPNAIPSSSVSVNYFANSSPKFVNANVDAAVYTKTGFQASFGSHAEINNNDYVYVYQIFNNGTSPDAATQAVTFLSVGITGGMSPYDISNTNNGNATFIAPDSDSFTADLSSAKWSYLTTTIPVNSTSQFLFFASPFSPGTHSATISASGILGTLSGTLPSPVPEPAAAAVLGLLASAGLLSRRRI